MGTFDNISVYERLGVRPSINAVGTGTVVGGSGPPKIVRDKMEEASRSFTDMGELLTRAGAFVADLMGTEAAFITSGGAAGWRRRLRPDGANAEKLEHLLGAPAWRFRLGPRTA